MALICSHGLPNITKKRGEQRQLGGGGNRHREEGKESIHRGKRKTDEKKRCRHAREKRGPERQKKVKKRVPIAPGGKRRNGGHYEIAGERGRACLRESRRSARTPKGRSGRAHQEKKRGQAPSKKTPRSYTTGGLIYRKKGEREKRGSWSLLGKEGNPRRKRGPRVAQRNSSTRIAKKGETALRGPPFWKQDNFKPKRHLYDFRKRRGYQPRKVQVALNGKKESF